MTDLPKHIPISDDMKVIPKGVNKFYIEFDKIRLIMERGEIIGWYESELDRVV